MTHILQVDGICLAQSNTHLWYVIGSKKGIPFLKPSSPTNPLPMLGGGIEVLGGTNQTGLFCRVHRYLQNEELQLLDQPVSTLVDLVFRKWLQQGRLSDMEQFIPILRVR